MKKILYLIFPFFLSASYAQSDYTINDLAPLYSARVASDKDGVGTITIIRKADKATLLKVEGNNLSMDDKSGKKTVAYKDQTIVVYEDFNFDGSKDLAIQEFFSTKGPSYVVYLAGNNTFQKDDAFTTIIQESQGSFTLDPVAKTISITSSGGCCSHSSATYVVKAGKATVVKDASEEITELFTTITSRVWTDGKKKETVDKSLMYDDFAMSFELTGKKKKVVLFVYNERILYYALVKENDKVEFNYPVKETDENSKFKLSPGGDELSFRNGTAEYKVYQKTNAGKIEAVGIVVKTGGKEYDLKGDVATLKGSLGGIGDADNLVK